MKQIQTFFKTSLPLSKALSFGKFAPQNFNYVKFYDPKEQYINNRAILNKQFMCHKSYTNCTSIDHIMLYLCAK